MKKVLVFCVLLSLALSLYGSSAWAVDVRWMQTGVRVWYFGAAGTTMSSDAEEAYLFTAVNGNNVQVTKHSAIDHWGTPNAPDTSTYSFLDKGPCWVHPQTLQNLQSGDTWKGQVISTVLRESRTYETFKAQFSFPYLLLPIKALFDLKSQRDLVKIVYYIDGFSTGIAYFDADTGLLLLYETSSGYVTVFFILSEINYDFASKRAFAEDDGPHTGFKSEAIETSTSGGANYVMIQSSVETRYGNTVQMWVSTSENSYSPPYENYCFFGSVPVLRRINMTEASNYPPEQWNEYGQYLWWWVPPGVLQNSTINVFGVPMTRTSTNPYTFTATVEPAGFFFSKLWFGSDGYMTAFSAKDSNTGLNIAPGQSNFTNLTTAKGLNYYRNTMGIATPTNSPPERMLIDFHYDFDGDGKSDILWQNSGGAVAMWLMNGYSIRQNQSPATVDSSYQIKGAGDFDGDGKADILWQNSAGAVVIWKMNGLSIVGMGCPATVDSSWQIKGIGDFDGDGKSDILWQHSSGALAIWLMNGYTIRQNMSPATVDSSYQIKGVGDFDGDGKADILWQNNAGAVVIWKMNGMTISGMGCPATVDSSWQIKGVGDFDGDGKSDVLWQNSAGAVAMWLMNGYSIRQNQSPATVDTSYQIKGAADFDGDGKSDILWQHSGGAVVIWKMNGLSISGMGCPATVDSSWQIKAP
jgi:hypothetical protein